MGLRLPIHLPKGKLRYPHARSYGMRYTRDNGEYLAMPEIAGKGGLLADPSTKKK